MIAESVNFSFLFTCGRHAGCLMPSPKLKAEVLKAAMLIRERGRLTKTLLEGGKSRLGQMPWEM